MTCIFRFLNEIDYLPTILETLYPVMERFILVEGANKFAWDLATEEGLSRDGSSEAVAHFPDPQGKITHIKLGRIEWEGHQCQAEIEPVEEGEIVCFTDADELWHPEDILRVKAKFYYYPETEAVQVKQRMFWGDLDHYVVEDDWSGRFWRKRKEDQFITDGSCMGVEMANYSQKAWTDMPEVHYLHLGWVRQAERLLEKCLYTCRWSRHFHPGSIPHIAGMDDQELKWHLLGSHPCFTGIPPSNWTIQKYERPLPQPLTQHRFYGKSPEEILDLPTLLEQMR